MSFSPSPGWIYDLLQAHLTQEELKQVESFIYAESWASPSARQRDWFNQEEELPLRFRLEIDMKV
ncbi:hypothetical protein ACFO25_10150 [Paenactinomyces guangxiensis]|uniref:Uncharacterized protein n=1 Tax=Paenactinomyces guangxiensis TaxID=1490290 RepID=A0A7W1WSQ4_9BACL|nr:hypothetical protein [Paenactinomyces guangxiensis]MBA4495146.1 hypothetical protein [Paenactinomyces guangxiensis]MBH8592170.1 hypothetical protein [Paenactinomyces guangxiensis]